MRKLQQTTILLLLLLGIIQPIEGHATPDTLHPSIFQKLVKEEINHIQLEADFDVLFNNKKERKEQAANLILVHSDSTTEQFKIKIRTRGVFRRRYCEIPPLRLNFNNEELAKMEMDSTFDKLKLVTHCMENPNAEQVLLKEYWAYRLYNNITPQSFKVHLVYITYINTKNKAEQSKHLAFLIENNQEMAARVGGQLVEKYGLTASKLTATSHQNSTLFNYMIGNLDWHIKRQRNIKLVQLPADDSIVIVPYDFDMSALVFPSYARLNPDYKQKRFTDRYCVERFTSANALEETVTRFKNLQAESLTAFKECPYLNGQSKSQMHAYLRSFYKLLKKEKKWKRQLL